MDYSQAQECMSARLRDRLANPGLLSDDARQKLPKLAACVGELLKRVPARDREDAERVLASELRSLMMDFCFQLNAHLHREDFDITCRSRGVDAAIDEAFVPFDEVNQLFRDFGFLRS